MPMPPDFSVLAAQLAEKVDGAVLEEFRIVLHVGATREAALGREGRDHEWSLSSEAGDVVSQIATILIDGTERHDGGPAAYAWFVLRQRGKTGNVAITPAIPIGGEDARGALVKQREDAVAALAAMAPETLRLIGGLLRTAHEQLTQARANELNAVATMAEAIGYASAGDENSKAAAMAEAAGAVAPVLQEAVAAWRASLEKGGAPPQTYEDFTAVWNAMPDDVKARVMRELAAAAQAQQRASETPPEKGA